MKTKASSNEKIYEFTFSNIIDDFFVKSIKIILLNYHYERLRCLIMIVQLLYIVILWLYDDVEYYVLAILKISYNMNGDKKASNVLILFVKMFYYLTKQK